MSHHNLVSISSESALAMVHVGILVGIRCIKWQMDKMSIFFKSRRCVECEQATIISYPYFLWSSLLRERVLLSLLLWCDQQIYVVSRLCKWQMDKMPTFFKSRGCGVRRSHHTLDPGSAHFLCLPTYMYQCMHALQVDGQTLLSPIKNNSR